MSSKEGSADGTQEQRARNDEQPPRENDTTGPTEGENEDCGSSAEKLPSGIPNVGPSRPSRPISDVSPNEGLAPEAEEVVVQKDQPNLSECVNVMKQVLDVLQDSTIATKGGKDGRSRFWTAYRRVAEEHDGDFLEQYASDMDIVLIFSGLFSAVSTSFIIAMESRLSPDPSDTTNALLTQLVQIGMGTLAAGSTPAAPASTWSPSTADVKIQVIAYASLCMSLLAAFGAVLGKQWLGHYKSHRYGRGSAEERAKHRQKMFDGIMTWYFDAVVQSFPILLQISLLLFGIALSANMWYEQHTIAWVIVAATVFGFLFYSLTVMASLVSPSCPFQTPVSSMLRMLRIDRVLSPMFNRGFKYFQQLMTPVHGVLKRLFDAIGSSWTRFSTADPVSAVGAFVWRFLGALHAWLQFSAWYSSKKVRDTEAQSLDLDPKIWADTECPLDLELSDILSSHLEAPSIKWLIETSTDPEVSFAAISLIPHVEWPLDLDVSDMLHQLYAIYTSLDRLAHVVPSLKERVSACTMALSHIYYGRVLQAHPDRGELLVQGKRGFEVFVGMQYKLGVHDHVIAPTITLSSAGASNDERIEEFSSDVEYCPDSVLEWLSHVLPYNFFTGRVNEHVESLALAVISKLVSSPSRPSDQIKANCTLLACVMVGGHFDKKDIARLDKSSALPKLAVSLLVHFQKALWTCGDLDRDSSGVGRRAWGLLDDICRILELGRPDHVPFPQAFGRNLDICRKFSFRAMLSEQNDPSDSTAAVRRILPFALATAYADFKPDCLWSKVPQSGKNYCSPENFDWLVDYLDYIYSKDHETAGDILLLLAACSSQVSCSPAKRYLFIERLIDCMGSDMPPRLRNTALRAAHSAREFLASIDVIDDARLRDMVITKFSPAVMSAGCPQPGVSSANDYFNYSPDLHFDRYYLELIFALARNSNWRPHLFGDHRIERFISMIEDISHSYLSPWLVGILRIAKEQLSDPLLESITEQQWYDLTIGAWPSVTGALGALGALSDLYYLEVLLILVEGTKKYVHISSKKYELELVIMCGDGILAAMETQDSEQGERVTVAVKELMAVVRDVLDSERFSQ